MIKKLFDELGYFWDQILLNAKNFGIPQNRERIFIVLTRKDLKKINIQSLGFFNNSKKKLKDILDFSEPTFKIKIENLLENQKDNIVKKNGKLFWKLSDKSLRQIFKIKEPNKTINIPHSKNFTNNVMATTDGIATTIMANSSRYIYFKNQMPNYYAKIIKLNYDKLFSQKKGELNVVANIGHGLENWAPIKYIQTSRLLGINGVFPTLANRNASDLGFIIYDRLCDETKLENMEIHYRKLSSKECWRLMGFADEWFEKVKKSGISNNQMEKQAGNSIVVNILEEIIKIIIRNGNWNEKKLFAKTCSKMARFKV